MTATAVVSTAVVSTAVVSTAVVSTAVVPTAVVAATVVAPATGAAMTRAAATAATRTATAMIPTSVAHTPASTHAARCSALRTTCPAHPRRDTFATAASGDKALDIRPATAAILGPAIDRRLLRHEQRARLDCTATALVARQRVRAGLSEGHRRVHAHGQGQNRLRQHPSFKALLIHLGVLNICNNQNENGRWKSASPCISGRKGALTLSVRSTLRA
jgi:hypothetical protein